MCRIDENEVGKRLLIIKHFKWHTFEALLCKLLYNNINARMETPLSINELGRAFLALSRSLQRIVSGEEIQMMKMLGMDLILRGFSFWTGS